MTDEAERLARLEVHVEYVRADLSELNGKVDKLLARPSATTQILAFASQHWKVLLIVLLTLGGAGWAAPILAALK
jgi:hypothetical protein